MPTAIYLCQLGLIEPWPVCKFEVTFVSSQRIHRDLEEINLKHKILIANISYDVTNTIKNDKECITCT